MKIKGGGLFVMWSKDFSIEGVFLSLGFCCGSRATAKAQRKRHSLLKSLFNVNVNVEGIICPLDDQPKPGRAMPPTPAVRIRHFALSFYRSKMILDRPN
jgi:hypothetical protein